MQKTEHICIGKMQLILKSVWTRAGSRRGIMSDSGKPFFRENRIFIPSWPRLTPILWMTAGDFLLRPYFLPFSWTNAAQSHRPDLSQPLDYCHLSGRTFT